MRRQGFTLIELLVVIAIIAILAAILFPVFTAVIKKAEAASCLSNQKQLMLAMLMYAHDYDTVLPTYSMGWFTWMAPYVQNVDLLFCPSQEGSMYGAYYLSGYIINGHGHSWRGKSFDYFPYPTHLAMFQDGKSNRGTYTDPNSGKVYYTPDFTYAGALALYDKADPPFWGGTNGFGVHGRHTGVCNVAFLDGHASAMPLGVLKANLTYYFSSASWVGGGQSFP